MDASNDVVLAVSQEHSWRHDRSSRLHAQLKHGLFILEQSTRNSSNTYTPVSEKIRMHASYTLSEM